MELGPLPVPCWPSKRQGSLIRAKYPDSTSSRLRAPQNISTTVGQDGRKAMKGEWCAGIGAGQRKNIGSRDCQKTGGCCGRGWADRQTGTPGLDVVEELLVENRKRREARGTYQGSSQWRCAVYHEYPGATSSLTRPRSKKVHGNGQTLLYI